MLEKHFRTILYRSYLQRKQRSVLIFLLLFSSYLEF